jgi:hypothetical protein
VSGAARRGGPRWWLEAASLAPALAAGVGLVRLTREPAAAHLVLPVAAAVVAGQLATGATRRLAGTVPAVACGVLAASLVAVWGALPSATAWGLPTAHGLGQVGGALAGAWRLTRATPTPVPATAGVVLAMAGGAGALAVCGRAILGAGPGPGGGGRRRAAWSLAPSAALACYGALLSSGSGRAQAAAGYLAGAVLFVLAADAAAAPARRGEAGAAARRGGAARARGAGAVMVVAGALVPLALGPALAGMHLSAFAAAPAPGPPGSLFGGSFDARALVDSGFLVDDLGATVGDEPDTLLFTARTPVPTYWQVATLDDFDGSSWLADPATEALAIGATDSAATPPTLPGPAGPTFSATVHLAALGTDLLPVPPDTVSVGRGHAVLLAPLGVVLPDGSAPGRTVTVRAVRPAPADQERASGVSGGRVAPYLRLPALPAEVVSLAHRLVAGATNPLAKALVLTGFFQGNGFRYSTDAQEGPLPLEGFLFGTRTGFCQQFAGAFAVLARLAGLPTRLAVGFTAGTAGPGGTYRVTAADAHVWPQVYLGPRLGWVSFEPTPASGDGPVRPPGVLGAPAPSPSGEPSSLAGGFLHGGALPPSAAPVAGQAPASPAAPRGARRATGPGGSGGWLTLALAAPAGVALLALVGTRRGRRRWRRRTGRALRPEAGRPSQAVVADWQRAQRALARRGLPRRAAETPLEHAARVAPRLDGAADAYRRLAEMATWAWCSSQAEVAGEPAAARALRRQVVGALRSGPSPPGARPTRRAGTVASGRRRPGPRSVQ